MQEAKEVMDFEPRKCETFGNLERSFCPIQLDGIMMFVVVCSKQY